MIRSRAYGGEVDDQRVRDLLVESYAITGTMHNWGTDCWDWFRYSGHVLEEIDGTRRCEDDGMFGPVGADPTHQRRGIGRALMSEGQQPPILPGQIAAAKVVTVHRRLHSRQ